MRRARLPREDDGVVRRGVAEAAVLDEVDTAQIGAGDVPAIVPPGLLARERCRAEEGGNERRDPCDRDDDGCSHDGTSPGTD